jgi:integrase
MYFDFRKMTFYFTYTQKIEDIWCFDLIGLDLKNDSSERTIPIAQYLLDLGLLDHIAELRKRGETLLFPEIRVGKDKPGSSGWGDPIGRWFSRTCLKNIGIIKADEKKKGKLVSFHSTRRTLISTCISNGEEHYLVKRIVGHSVEDDITMSVYADIENIPMKKLKEVLDKNLTWHLNDTMN